jgi:hypothetical protein
MIDEMHAAVDRVVRLRDGRAIGYAQYGTRPGPAVPSSTGPTTSQNYSS